MEFLKAIFYGIVQGLTEFLPVSSSGHLAILKNIFGLEGFDNALLFTVLLHLGTLISVLIVYFNDVKDMFFGFFSLIKKVFTGKYKYKTLTSGEKFILLIIIAVIPLFAAVLIDKKIEFIADNTKVIGILLILNSVILFFSDRIGNTYKKVKEATPTNALAVGLIQIIAILPGISRSGTTITGGLLNKFDREFAVKFSFILSIPAILGANVFEVAKFVKSDSAVTSDMIICGILGIIFAAAAGIAAIKLINFVAKKKNFYIFSLYCFVVGLVAIIFG